MALTVTFGNGGSANTTNLVADKGTYQTLNGPTVSSQSPEGSTVGQVIDGSSQNVGKAQVAGSGTGGTVDIGFTDNTFSFDVSTAWNSVKNAYVTNGGSTAGEKVVLTDFVQADVDFSSATGDSTVTINDVKRSNVTTGSGNDTVTIKLAANAAVWQNVINVDTGAGNDTIKIDKGSVSDGATITDGRLTDVTIKSGAGNDTIDLSGLNLKSSQIYGGTGNDTITLSNGADTVHIEANNGRDVINNFDAAKDTLVFDGGNPVQTVDLGDGSTLYKFAGNNSVIVNSVLAG